MFLFLQPFLAHDFNLISGIYTLVHQRRCHEDDEICFLYSLYFFKRR